jgi:hypothetical protein
MPYSADGLRHRKRGVEGADGVGGATCIECHDGFVQDRRPLYAGCLYCHAEAIGS